MVVITGFDNTINWLRMRIRPSILVHGRGGWRKARIHLLILYGIWYGRAWHLRYNGNACESQLWWAATGRTRREWFWVIWFIWWYDGISSRCWSYHAIIGRDDFLNGNEKKRTIETYFKNIAFRKRTFLMLCTKSVLFSTAFEAFSTVSKSPHTSSTRSKVTFWNKWKDEKSIHSATHQPKINSHRLSIYLRWQLSFFNNIGLGFQWNRCSIAPHIINTFQREILEQMKRCKIEPFSHTLTKDKQQSLKYIPAMATAVPHQHWTRLPMGPYYLYVSVSAPEIWNHFETIMQTSFHSCVCGLPGHRRRHSPLNRLAIARPTPKHTTTSE